MNDEINTHGMKLHFGKHAGESYTRVPISYLRWMVNVGHNEAHIALAELKRRGVPVQNQAVEITGHAIDSASLRVRNIWHKDRMDQEGLHAWLLRISEEALNDHTMDHEGRIHYKGMRLVFEDGDIYPILKTVMRKNSDQ